MTHQASFAQAEARFGVPPQVVVAILSVETRLGSYLGQSPACNVLASQAVLDTPAGLDRLRAVWPATRRNEVGSSRNRERFSKRARWARGELAALLRLSEQAGRSPFAWRGSPAGALGLPQFMPSNVQAYGKDGDQDGRVDLFAPPDAIASVANYLRRNGWHPGLSHERQVAVVLTYNNSRPYAETVLELAGRVAR